MKNIFIYIHVPFCLSKCIYCDFYSLPLQSMKRALIFEPSAESKAKVSDYVCAVRNEINIYEKKGFFRDANIKTLYFGGGTPSLMSAEDIESVLKEFRIAAKFDSSAEITLEVNPATADFQKLFALRKSGVNRLSIGCQSFKDKDLQMLRRRHSASDNIRIIEDARSVGFENIGIDVIFGIPGSTCGEWIDTLKTVSEYKPEHLSCYGITVESETVLSDMVSDGRVTLPSDEEQREMYVAGTALLKNKGYRHYEISNFAKPGFESVNNLNYWNGDEYLGFGASAHSSYVSYDFLGYIKSRRRSWNITGIDDYIKCTGEGKVPAEAEEELTENKLAAEAVMLGLRMTEGIDRNKFLKKYGVDVLSKWKTEVEKMQSSGLVAVEDGRLMLTMEGILLSDGIFKEFMPSALP